MSSLSVIIPGRNEMFMARTISDVLRQSRGDTEVIAIVDGGAAGEPIAPHPRVRVVVNAESIGQRQSCNQAARLSSAKYIMKLDAHCTVDEGFDVKLMAECRPDWTVIPRMYNLHAFDWVCGACNHRTYQGPTPERCAKCKMDGGAVKREMVWKPRWNRVTDFARFDSDLHFQYWGEYKHRPSVIAQGDIADVMSFVGACWFLERERYWALDGSDEAHGSWGQQGVEIACKSWLSGGRVVVNKRTWFSHMFRTQGGDFGFPYSISGNQVERARKRSRELWMDGTWPKAVHDLRWLLDKFGPVPGWEGKLPPSRTVSSGNDTPAASDGDRTLTRGAVYYTDNLPNPALLAACRRRLRRAFDGPISAVSINGPVSFEGDSWQNVELDLERGHLTMFKQILAGLEASDADVVFLTEHDVLYHPSHFDFTPPRDDTFYYNRNVWKVDMATGRALHYLCDQTSGLCASRQLLLEHYRARVARVEREGFDRHMGFEPGTRKIRHGGIDDHPSATWMSALPNVDVRHDKNLTASRWKKEQFRNQKYCEGWTEAEEVPGWGKPAEFLKEIT